MSGSTDDTRLTIAEPHRDRRVPHRLADAAVTVLEAALRLAGPRAYRHIAAQLHERVQKPFTLEEITYYPEPCSVGHTPHGHVTGASAAEMIQARGLSRLRVLDICCGVGIVGLTMLARLRGEGRITSLTLADINVFNISSVEKTLARGARKTLEEYEILVLLSDGLQHLPEDSQFDLIVSNPPHYGKGRSTDDALDPNLLGTYDTDWGFHERFFSSCHRYLSETGEVWFLEAREASSEQDLPELISANPQLRLIETTIEPRDDRMYWITVLRQ